LPSLSKEILPVYYKKRIFVLFCVLSDARLGVAAAILGILGLLSIYYFENAAAARNIDVAEVKYAKQGELVRFEGTVAKITQKEDGATLQICNSGACANMYVPSSAKNPYLFEKGQIVEVEARIDSLYGNNVLRLQKISIGE
jgi:hypothetical protein